MKKLGVILSLIFVHCGMFGQADYKVYLNDVKAEMEIKWPYNRTINLVYHGHSVPTGYYTAGVVHTFDAYPRMATKLIKEIYPYAVINTITTSIGGENATKGVTRFMDDVIPMKPDILFIDYGLNDRNKPIDEVKAAWEEMVDSALALNIKVILLTPTPDISEDILSDEAPLAAYAQQIRDIAADKEVGLIDSYQYFKDLKAGGTDLAPLMAQANHINKDGHQMVANLIYEWFGASEHEASLYFPFEEQVQEVADSFVYDSGNAISLMLANAQVVNDEERGNVLSLTPGSGHAKFSAAPIAGNDFSISFWINSSESDAWKYMMQFKETNGHDLLGMTIQKWASPYTFCFYRDQLAGQIKSNTVLPLNEWHHIAMTNINGVAAFYYDGVQASTVDFDLSTLTFTDFYLGCINGKTAQCKLDDLMFFEGALSAENVNDLYFEQKENTPTDLSDVKNTSLLKVRLSEKKISVIVPQELAHEACRVISINGAIVLTQNLEMNQTIDASALSAGCYIVKVANEAVRVIIN